jgi:ribosomal protein S18 acetylase RimI-like enzyme
MPGSADIPGAAAVTVRDAGPADRPALVAMCAALQDAERPLHANRRPPAEMAEPHFADLERMVGECGGFILAAEADGRPAGYLIGLVQVGEAYLTDEYRTFGLISDIYVEDFARRRGAARALTAEAEWRFAAMGLAQVQVGVLCANAPARRAYQALGFAPYEMYYEKRLGEAPSEPAL